MIEESNEIDIESLWGDEEDISAPPSPEEFNDSTPTMEYPCVYVKGMLSEDEADFFVPKFGQGKDQVNFYIDVGGIPDKRGTFSVCIDNILLLAYMKYEAVLITPTGAEYDLRDENNWLNFI